MASAVYKSDRPQLDSPPSASYDFQPMPYSPDTLYTCISPVLGTREECQIALALNQTNDPSSHSRNIVAALDEAL